MSKFMLRDIENLKRAGSSVQDIHYNLANTVLNSDNIAANVRTLDKKTGQFEIVLTGTIDKSVLDREMGSEKSGSQSSERSEKGSQSSERESRGGESSGSQQRR